MNVRKRDAVVRGMLTDLIPVFHLQGWQADIDYAPKDEGWIAASTNVNAEYRRFRIVLRPIFFRIPVREAREALIHELCHVVLSSVQDVATDLQKGDHVTDGHLTHAVETSTSWMAQVVSALLKV